MNTPAEILNIAKVNKTELLKYFFSHSNYLGKQLEVLQKHELNALLFLTIEKPFELSSFLKTSFFDFQELINKPTYKYYTIPKKKGGIREIYAPDNELKSIQKHLNYFLQAYYLCIKPKEVHGFVINPNYLGTYCNIVGNAKLHVQKKYVLNIDLRDFFPSISARRVRDLFISPHFNFGRNMATALTLLTTYKGSLPIGAPTSPVISNFICLQLDSDLRTFCAKNHLTFSRYADDLTFSSDYQITNDNILDIINLIKKNNFEINEKKLRLKATNRKQTVTGLTVNEKVNVDRKLLKKIRAMLHDLSTNGIDIAVQRHFKHENIDQKHRAKFINRLDGYINFVGQVRGKNDSLYLRQKSSLVKLVSGREE